MQWKPENVESFLPVPHRDGCLSMAKIKGEQQGYSCHSAINPISAAEYMHSNLYCLIRHILGEKFSVGLHNKNYIESDQNEYVMKCYEY